MSALGIIHSQSHTSYPSPSLVEFHPWLMRLSGQPKIKGKPTCRSLDLFLPAASFFSALLCKFQLPPPVFSAQCAQYVLFVFPLRKSGTTIGFTLLVFLLQTALTIVKYLRAVFPTFDQCHSWLQRTVSPMSLLCAPVYTIIIQLSLK